MSNTRIDRRSLVAGAVAASAWGGQAASAQDAPVRIGELNSYSRMAAFCLPYRNAMQLAVEEINAQGGLKSLGARKFEIVFRDDGSTPGDAVRAAEELLTRENAAFIAGGFLSNVGLALADLANQRKTLYVATEPLTDALTLAQGNPYTFRIRPNTYMQTRMLVDAVKDKGVKRWAIVAPNYEYGTSAAAAFKRLMTAAVPGFEVVVEQFPALGKVEPGPVVGALAQARPDGIFNVLFGADLPAFVREGNNRGLFEKRLVASLLTGEPEYLLPLGDETPEGWIVTGYPADQIKDGPHGKFIAAYTAKFNEAPRCGSLLGYVSAHIMRDLIEKAGSTESGKLIAAFNDATFDSILGPIRMRGLDHQSTFGAWVGETTLNGRTPAMKNWKYVSGEAYLHPEDEVKAVRKS
ncbi:MAG: twin-arginine translocation pathway signal protein [Rhizobiales bacterium 65-9]|nr:ABC transporter substrate-binding protein [Hyphomicrobiales bacterium]OJY36066.1 MAG: twin-arginine translocation pathway signal protein [Rhizobiales bacterium 65-9]